MKNYIIKGLLLLAVAANDASAVGWTYPACAYCWFGSNPGGIPYATWACNLTAPCTTPFTPFGLAGSNASNTPKPSTLVNAVKEQKVTTGIDYDLAVLSEISKINPWTMLVLHSVHKDHRNKNINLLHGLLAFQRFLTTESVSSFLDGESDMESIGTLAQPTPENQFVQVRWTGQEMPGQKLLVTFVTEMIDDTAEKRFGQIAPTIEVEFATTVPYTLVSWREVK